MKHRHFHVLVTTPLAAAALMLTGCSTDEPSTTATVTQTEAVSSELATEEPLPTPDAADAMQTAWDTQTAQDRSDICDGWAISKPLMIDAFMEEGGDSFTTRSEVRVFFDGKCGADSAVQ